MKLCILQPLLTISYYSHYILGAQTQAPSCKFDFTVTVSIKKVIKWIWNHWHSSEYWGTDERKNTWYEHSYELERTLRYVWLKLTYTSMYKCLFIQLGSKIKHVFTSRVKLNHLNGWLRTITKLSKDRFSQVLYMLPKRAYDYEYTGTLILNMHIYINII